MIKTEIISASSQYAMWEAFDRAIEVVNSYIKRHDITKEDIVEYKTERIAKGEEKSKDLYDEQFTVEITLSYWNVE